MGRCSSSAGTCPLSVRVCRWCWRRRRPPIPVASRRRGCSSWRSFVRAPPIIWCTRAQTIRLATGAVAVDGESSSAFFARARRRVRQTTVNRRRRPRHHRLLCHRVGSSVPVGHFEQSRVRRFLPDCVVVLVDCLFDFALLRTVTAPTIVFGVGAFTDRTHSTCPIHLRRRRPFSPLSVAGRFPYMRLSGAH